MASRLYGALMEVQSTLKAPKGQKNTFGGYNYRSAEDIIEAVKPLLKKNGLYMKLDDEIRQVGDRFYVQATVTVYDTESGESIQASALAREALARRGMDESQITGSASSYARKYALNGMFGIDDTKDMDALPPEQPIRAENRQGGINALSDEVKRIGATWDDVKRLCVKHFKKGKSSDLSSGELAALVKNLEAWIQEETK